MTPGEQFEKLPQNAPRQEAIAIAQAYCDQTGELPEMIWYQLGRTQDDPAEREALWTALHQLRREHFHKLGRAMPPYTGEYI